MARSGHRNEQHEMESGLTHYADSLAGGRRGTFVDRFGPPKGPTERDSIGKDNFAGRAPDLHKKFFSERQD